MNRSLSFLVQRRSLRKKALSLVKAKLDRVLAQKEKLNETDQLHTKLAESKNLLVEKQLELAEIESECRIASSKSWTPAPSVAASVELQSKTTNQSLTTCLMMGQPVTKWSRVLWPLVRNDVLDGKRRCGSALPAPRDLGRHVGTRNWHVL